MKKKLKNVILAVFLSIISFLMVFNCNNLEVHASTEKEISFVNKTQMNNTINVILKNFVQFNERFPGSDQEKIASAFIKNYLDENTNCVPLDNGYVKDGIQTFTFNSIYEYGDISQNIIYTIPGKALEDKNVARSKVVLTCGYDMIAYKIDSYSMASIVSSQGVNQSAGSVALLLALAEYLPVNTFDFDIDIIFFGATNSNLAGSKFYSNGIGDEEAKNILLAINLDNISIGKNLYFYIDEVETKLNSFSKDVFKENKTGVKEVDITNLGKVILDYRNELGLTYTHIAQSSNNYNFMKSGVLSMNIFAGDYENGITMGKCEYYNVKVISYTENDNLKYIQDNIGEDVIGNNLYNVYQSILSLISNSEFESVCTSSFGQNNLFYSIFGNENLEIYLAGVAFIIFVIFAFITHHKLTIKAYDANIENEFVSTVLNITSNVDTKSSNDSVPKAISEIIAEDIKKDKRIKKK